MGLSPLRFQTLRFQAVSGGFRRFQPLHSKHSINRLCGFRRFQAAVSGGFRRFQALRFQAVSGGFRRFQAVSGLNPILRIGKNRLFLKTCGLSEALDLALDSGLASELEDLVTKLGVIRIRPCQARPSSDPAIEPSSQYGKAIGSYLPSVPN
jgi:hypothetical protein